MEKDLIEELRRKVAVIISRYETLEAENATLKESLSQCKNELTNYKEKTDILEKQIDNLRLTKAFENTSADSADAKRKVRSLVREIDRCIALLNN